MTMFIRIKTVGNRDGTKRKYLQLCENRREDGRVRQKVLCNLGRLEELQKGQLDKLICSLAKFSDSIVCIKAEKKQAEESALPE